MSQANKSLWVKQGEDKHLDFSKLIRPSQVRQHWNREWQEAL